MDHQMHYCMCHHRCLPPIQTSSACQVRRKGEAGTPGKLYILAGVPDEHAKRTSDDWQTEKQRVRACVVGLQEVSG